MAVAGIKTMRKSWASIFYITQMGRRENEKLSMFLIIKFHYNR